jgi:hypothetical protein
MKKFKRKNPIYLNDPDRKRAGRKWVLDPLNTEEDHQIKLENQLRHNKKFK